MKRLVFLLALAVAGVAVSTRYSVSPETEQRRDAYLKQFQNDDSVPQAIRADYTRRNLAVGGSVALFGVLAIALYYRDIRALLTPGESA